MVSGLQSASLSHCNTPCWGNSSARILLKGGDANCAAIPSRSFDDVADLDKAAEMISRLADIQVMLFLSISRTHVEFC